MADGDIFTFLELHTSGGGYTVRGLLKYTAATAKYSMQINFYDDILAGVVSSGYFDLDTNDNHIVICISRSSNPVSGDGDGAFFLNGELKYFITFAATFSQSLTY